MKKVHLQHVGDVPAKEAQKSTLESPEEATEHNYTEWEKEW